MIHFTNIIPDFLITSIYISFNLITTKKVFYLLFHFYGIQFLRTLLIGSGSALLLGIRAVVFLHTNRNNITVTSSTSPVLLSFRNGHFSSFSSSSSYIFYCFLFLLFFLFVSVVLCLFCCRFFLIIFFVFCI